MAKPKQCACGCGEEIEPQQYLRFKWVNYDHKKHWLQTSEAGQKAIVKAARKAINDAEKKKRKDDNVKREGLKTLGEHEKEARKVFQKWIRLRDEKLPCISCGCLTAKQWDGGHFLKAELFSGTIFYENNCHKQCSRCNDLYSGNELEYRDGLIARYGLDYVLEIESRKAASRVYRYTKDELKEIKNKYLNLIKNNLLG